jgi:glutathione S-transferase
LIEGPRYAFENRVTLADCVLIAPLFFSTVAAPAFGADVLSKAPKVKAYYEALAANEPSAAKTVAEIGAALAAFQASRS